MIELKELTDKTLSLFDINNCSDLGEALLNCVENNDEAKMEAFLEIVDGDLSKDWLQMIYQYYNADRVTKKQDYTPKSLAKFLSLLIGESTTIIDMCAGSGALSIQQWTLNPDAFFELYEIDKNVIPYLIFNMAIRNANAVIYQSDVLQQEVTNKWQIKRGERFGKVSCIKSAV